MSVQELRLRSVNKTASFGNSEVLITGNDAARLLENRWLNDNLVEYFMYTAADNSAARQRCLVLPTSFYTDLVSGHPRVDIFNVPEIISTALQRADYIKVQASVTPIEDCDLLVLPINTGTHWLLGVVVKPADQIRDADSRIADQVGSSIMLFDSLPDHIGESGRTEIAENLRALIACARYFQRPNPTDADQAPVVDDRTLPAITMSVPQQQNKHDCGVHVILTARLILRDVNRFMEQYCRAWPVEHALSNLCGNAVHVGSETRQELLKSLLPRRS